MSADAVNWWQGHQFGIVPRACIDAIVHAASHADNVAAPTAVAVFTALAVTAGRNGAAEGGQVGAAHMLAMSPGAVRRVVATVLEPAGVATRHDGSVVLHTPAEAPEARRAAREPTPEARHPARPTRAVRRDPPRHPARTPITDVDTENESDPPVTPPTTSAQLALVPPAALPPAAHVLGSDRDVWFARFWEVFPRKVAKGAARTAWSAAIRRQKATPEDIIQGAERYATDPNRDPAFTAHPATWLNAERWGDEPEPDRTAPGPRAPTTAMGATVGHLRELRQSLAAGPAPRALGDGR